MKQTELTIRIILTFGIMFLMSFLPSLNPELFGDWLCEGSKYGQLIKETGVEYEHFERLGCWKFSYHSPEWHWGWRHWILILMSFTLFIQQVVYIINRFDKR